MTKRREDENYEGDPLIPILNLVCMLIPLLLYGAVFMQFMVVDVNAPRIVSGPPPQQSSDALDLSVMITDQGFHFRVNPTKRLPWMNMSAASGTTGPDIPRRDNDFDYAELRRKLLEIKSANRTEMNITISAEDDISYEVLLRAMDHSRGDADHPLFPVVTLSRGLVV